MVDVDDFAVKLDTTIAKLVSAILKPVRREMSGRLEWLDAPDGLIAFGTSKTMIGEIVYVKPLRDRVNVGFFHGAKLSDPLKLLEGTGKSLRHVKIRRPEDVDNPAFVSLLRAARSEHDARLGKEKRTGK